MFACSLRNGLKVVTFVSFGLAWQCQQTRADPSPHVPKAFQHRDASVRKQIALTEGGNEASEAAVEAALKWLGKHQDADGRWSFDHTDGECKGQCGDPGVLRQAKFAATGLALLTFLGRGETDAQGQHQQAIKNGLEYLCANMSVTPNGGNMTRGGGSLYGQAIATQALAEAYGLTQEKRLLEPAQAAVNFVVYAQEPMGGGWRYVPHQPGDMSSTGWQIMALKSAYSARMPVPQKTVAGAIKFLDSMQSDNGAGYGYTGPGRGPATSAEGLLCRIHLGWQRDKPELRRGVERLAAIGPTTRNLYFSYAATQVLHEFDGPDGELWKAWNNKTRDQLIIQQSKTGHEAGSWMFTGTDHGYEIGGRLYCTTLAALTLEVYYRYVRVYQAEAADKLPLSPEVRGM